jgi:pimeloyl-ACP methyl ester carboxylesterase
MNEQLVAYTDQGDGQPIVLLHGFPLSRRMWNAQVEAWSHDFRVIAPDFRGFGDSALAKEFSMTGCAEDVHELLVSLRIQDGVVLLGLSMGGYISFEFVRRYQEMLRGLILVATQPAGDSDTARQARYETAESVRREGSSALAERLIPRFLGKTTFTTKPEVADALRTLIRSNAAESIAQACYGLAARRDSTSFLPDIKVPTLIVAGSEDALISSTQAETMRRQIPHSRLLVVEHCGHIINLEQADQLNQIVKSFVQDGLGTSPSRVS